MKIVFIMRHSGFVRNFEPALRLLCERGHRVHVAFLGDDPHWLADTPDLAQRLCDQFPGFSRGSAPAGDDAWKELGRELRGRLDYLRYLTPRYRAARKLRARAARDVSTAVLRKTERGAWGTHAGRSLLSAWYRLLERSIPVNDQIDAFFAEHRPDLLLVSPLIEPGSPQREYIRAAQMRRITTVLCVGSWDNLTNKGLIHGRLDLVTVWNEYMRREAIELHGVPPERIAVTGAVQFDDWFTWKPNPREMFCARVGLDSTQPYLLYLCSSKFVAPDEATFVRTWVNQLRQSSSAGLRNLAVLIRPHPQNEHQWRRVDPADLPHCTIYPKAGAVPIDAASKADYFDSIYHSASVVGINTTAEIESAIVGRSVYTLLAPEFQDTQGGTLHFHYLKDVGGGVVHVAHDFPEHLAQLDAGLRGKSNDEERCRRFVELFVRPHGIDKTATSRLVGEIESVAARPAVDDRPSPVLVRLLRPLLARHAAEAVRDAATRLETKIARRTLRERHAKERRRKHREARRNRRAEAGETA